MFGNVEGIPNLNQVANPEPPLLPLFPNQPMNIDQNQENQIPNPDYDPMEIPRIPAPNPIEQGWNDNWAIQELLNNPPPMLNQLHFSLNQYQPQYQHH